MMRALPDDLPFDQLHIDTLSSYLLSTGWKRAEPKYSDMLDFTRDVPGRDLPDLITIPADEQSIIFKGFMAMAVLRLADIEEMTPQEIAEEILDTAYYLQQTADKDLEEERTVEGLVVNLNTEKPGKRIVTLSTEEWSEVSFAAEPDQHAFACDAYREGKIINVRGKLSRGKGKSWILLNPHDLQYA